MRVQINFTKRFLPLLDVSLMLVGIFIIALTVGKFSEEVKGLRNVYAFKIEDNGNFYYIGKIKGDISFYFHSNKKKVMNFNLKDIEKTINSRILKSKVKKENIVIALIFPKKSKKIKFSDIERFKSWILLLGYNFMYVGQ